MRVSLHEIRHHVTLEVDCDAADAVMGTSTRVAHLLINLIMNAYQAMPANKPEENRIVVRATNEPEYVRLEVVDNGPGIPAPILPQIFDPHFTTRATSGGTGIGLSLCRSIVKSMGGRIGIDTEEGLGTRVIVRLVRAKES